MPLRQRCCSESGNSQVIAPRARNEFPLPREPASLWSYFKCFAADSSCQGRLRWEYAACLPCPGQTTEPSMPMAKNRSRRRGRCIPLPRGLTAAQCHTLPGHWLLLPSSDHQSYPVHPPPQLVKFWDSLLERSSLQPFCCLLPWCGSKTPTGPRVPNSVSVWLI